MRGLGWCARAYTVLFPTSLTDLAMQLYAQSIPCNTLSYRRLPYWYVPKGVILLLDVAGLGQ